MEEYKRQLHARREKLLRTHAQYETVRCDESVPVGGTQQINKDRYEQLTLSAEDVIDTDEGKKAKLKTSGFLITINTNKNKTIINTELLSKNNNDGGEYGYENMCAELENAILEELKKPEYLVPKLFKRKIDESLWEDLRKLIVRVDVEPGAWEESTDRNGRKIHIHITLRVIYSGMFIGFFHVDTHKLQSLVRSAAPELNWGRGPYINIRYIKEMNLTVAQYIHKLEYTENMPLYEKTVQRITEYQQLKNKDDELSLWLSGLNKLDS
jgi:hypothetical protein